MPRLSQALPAYRKHKASGQAVVTLSGRDYYLGKHGSKDSRTAYERLVGEWLKRGRQRQDATKGGITVVELCLQYLGFAESYYVKDGKPTGATTCIKASIKYLREWYGREPAAEFGPLALKAVRERMVVDGLSRRYVNDHVDRIKRLFKWAVGEELVPPATYQALAVVPGLRRGRTEARETEPVLPVGDAVVDATLEHMQPIAADMVRLQRYSGMRPAEVCLLRPCDMDRKADVWIFRPHKHKTQHHGRDRVVPLGPKAQEILLRYLARDPEAYCFRPVDSEAKRRAALTAARTTPLSCGNRPGSNRRRRPKRQPGEVYPTNSYRRAIYRGCDKAFLHPTLAGIPRKKLTAAQQAELALWQSDHRWAPNRLRHAAATDIRRQFGLEAAKAVLGHAKSTTTEIYAEQDMTKGVAVARAIG
jgi:integrase